jgi:type IV fimbrial biogenesis protein FimT
MSSKFALTAMSGRIKGKKVDFSLLKPGMGPGGSLGFTLIELIVTMAVAAILFVAAMPSLTIFIQNNRSTARINELHASLSLARSEAVKRNNNVSICKSSNGTGCAGHAGHWHHGWIVFVDNDADGVVDDGEGDEIVRVQGALTGSNTLTFSQTHVLYASNGIARAGSNGTFTFCDTRGAASAKGLVIGPSGRPRLAFDSDSNGILEDGGNVDLECSS